MIWVCKTILSDGLDKCYFLQKNVEVLITPTIILEPFFLNVLEVSCFYLFQTKAFQPILE